MPRLVIITTPELENGYKLAGGTVIRATSAMDAEEQVRKLVADRDVAVIGVHGPFWHGFGAPLLRELEARTLPLVIEIPGGVDGERAGRRARIIELLRHAIGHRITFGQEGAP